MLFPETQAVAFDLDGTLANTMDDLIDAVLAMLEELRLPKVEKSKLQQLVGNGSRSLVKEALQICMQDPYTSDFFAQAEKTFLDCYQNNLCQKTTLYPFALETLNTLQKRSIKIACATNKNERFALPLLVKLGIDTIFDITICGDSLDEKKPSPMPLLHIAEKFTLQTRQLLMVGDSYIDVQAAKNAGSPVACVDYGYNQGFDIMEAKPDLLVSQLHKICDHIPS